jgi:hypothetical protein
MAKTKSKSATANCRTALPVLGSGNLRGGAAGDVPPQAFANIVGSEFLRMGVIPHSEGWVHAVNRFVALMMDVSGADALLQAAQEVGSMIGDRNLVGPANNAGITSVMEFGAVAALFVF